MSNNYYKDLKFRVCGYDSDNLIFTKYYKTKEEAINFFNYCCSTTFGPHYDYEIWDDNNSALLFSTED